LRSHDWRKNAYDSNKMIVCSIVKASIDLYYTYKLQKNSNYASKEDSLVWLLTTIKLFCSYDIKEQDLT